jgi:hypothetical protein
MTTKCSIPVPHPCKPKSVTDTHLLDAFTLRFSTATQDAELPTDPQTPNDDETTIPDWSGTYSKCILQDSYGVVNATAFKAFRTATKTGDFSQFEALTLGGKTTLNGPMASYAYTFIGPDSSQYGGSVVPAAPKVNSELYATELIELYWCSLLRDTHFSNYPSSSTAIEAAAELSLRTDYQGPVDPVSKHVTPGLLFRGNFVGERVGPYLSQFLLTPTKFGAADFPQKYTTYMPGVDYMTDLDSWFAVQNGQPTGIMNQKDPTPRYLHDGRGLAAYTHVDVLYQAYFTAFLVLNSINAAANPGNPYLHSKTQNGFGTFGGPDISSVLADVAKIALNAVWYQKWVVHLRHRPEAGGGLVHLYNSKSPNPPKGKPSDSVLMSKAVAASFDKYQSYLLSQPFPEGSPAHPAYPTGHGTVAGACITILKFFYDGTFPLNQLVPDATGDNLLAWDNSSWTGDPGILTVHGELNKLAHNVSFGHGIHGGIHWRTDTDASIKLGEAVAIHYLQELVCSYAEKVNITFKDVMGNDVTITN